MRNYSPIKITYQKFPTVVVILLVVVLLSGYAGIQNHLANGGWKRFCSMKDKSPEALIDVNEMLLSIKSFSLSDDTN